MKKLSIAQKAYVAGFLDGDGSIYVRLKPNATYRFRHQVAPCVVLFQSRKERLGLERIHRLLGVGYIRERTDGVLEYTISDVESIRSVLTAILPHLYLKKRQAALILRILSKKERVKTARQFLELCVLIDAFQHLNYSKRRLQTSATVRAVLEREGFLTP